MELHPDSWGIPFSPLPPTIFGILKPLPAAVEAQGPGFGQRFFEALQHSF